jgi:hypothetical protein
MISNFLDPDFRTSSPMPASQFSPPSLFLLQELSAEDVARRSMKIASDTCIYTNHNYVIETIDLAEAAAAEKVPAGDSASSAKDNKGEDKVKK